MLLKLKCKIGDDVKETLINRESINCVVPFGNFTHIYINNIATPLVAHVDFKTIEGFLSSVFHEGVVGTRHPQTENEECEPTEREKLLKEIEVLKEEKQELENRINYLENP